MKSEDCVCYFCNLHKDIMAGIGEYDCACESGPFYDEEACGACKYRDTCDVPHESELYL